MLQRTDREELARLQHQEDVRAVLATADGRRLLWWVIDGLALAHGGSFGGEATHTSAFNEGRRDVGITLKAELLRYAPEGFATMLVEAVRSQVTEEQLRQAEEHRAKAESDE